MQFMQIYITFYKKFDCKYKKATTNGMLIFGLGCREVILFEGFKKKRTKDSIRIKTMWIQLLKHNLADLQQFWWTFSEYTTRFHCPRPPYHGRPFQTFLQQNKKHLKLISVEKQRRFWIWPLSHIPFMFEIEYSGSFWWTIHFIYSPVIDL